MIKIHNYYFPHFSKIREIFYRINKIALLSFNIVFFHPLDIALKKRDSPRKGFCIKSNIHAFLGVCFLGINFNAAIRAG